MNQKLTKCIKRGEAKKLENASTGVIYSCFNENLCEYQMPFSMGNFCKLSPLFDTKNR